MGGVEVMEVEREPRFIYCLILRCLFDGSMKVYMYPGPSKSMYASLFAQGQHLDVYQSHHAYTLLYSLSNAG